MDAIVDAYKKRTNEPHFSVLVKRDDIVKNDYNLSVSSYVEPEDTREMIDIKAVNKRLIDVVKKTRELQKYIDELTIKGL